MFVRVKSTPNSPRRSVQIVESIRKGNKVSQKIIRHVGIAFNEKEEQQLRDMATDSIALLKQERLAADKQGRLFPDPSLEELRGSVGLKKRGRPRRKTLDQILPTHQVSLDDIAEEARVVEGVHEVAGSLYDQLYQGLFKSKKANTLVKDLVLARLVEPVSKRRTQHRLHQQFAIHHELDAIYRVMDNVYDQIDTIKRLTFEKTQALFPQGVDLLLFDVTTLYFESIHTDSLRAYGYSKDHRFNTTQLVLALATNTEGLPVGYELFEGNKAEVSTLIEAIESWNQLFSVGQVCFVGDRAMMSKANIQLLESKGYHYIIACKLRSLPKPLKQTILNERYYQPCVCFR